MGLLDSVGKCSYLNDNSKGKDLGRCLYITEFVAEYGFMEN